MWKWKSLKDLFAKLNEMEYVILRNYETMLEDIDEGGDIDILCSNKAYLTEQIHAYPRVLGSKVFNYFVMIEEKKIPIDIREVGDGYYDKKWERNMINKRVKTAEYYIMDDENYKYSLLYHSLIHKPTIKKTYINRLSDMFGTEIGNDDKTNKLLGDYMYEMGYSIPIPVDKGVEFNKVNYTKIFKTIELQK